jgi:hypothetical protein
MIGNSRRVFEVLVLRDPFNLFASRLQCSWGNMALNQVAFWLEHASEFVGKTSYLQNKLVVSFNDWFRSEDYRRNLAEAIGRPFSDKALQNVSPWGDGSSFDGKSFDGRAQQMAVLDRWRHFQDDDRYRQLFDRPELWQLAEQVFDVSSQALLRPQTTRPE